MADLRIGVAGCAGRMGRALVRAAADDGSAVVAAGSEAPGSPWIGRDVGETAGGPPLGIAVAGHADALFGTADVVLDFTTPRTVAAHAALARETGTAWVLGTTGAGPDEDSAVRAAAAAAPIVRAANMSLGINLLLGLVRRAAAVLDASFDAEVVEMHHRHKVDAPSGTALALGRAVARARGQDHDEAAVFGRRGQTGARARGAIGYAALRGGNVAGEHAVVFAADDERVELVHRAGSRAIFARGALRAAHWAHGRPPGLYRMQDVLGLDDDG